MILRCKVSSIENGKYKVTIPDRENVVSQPLIKAEHVGTLEIGDNVIAVFFSDQLTGVIIAKF